jgi:hypothetical protein
MLDVPGDRPGLRVLRTSHIDIILFLIRTSAISEAHTKGNNKAAETADVERQRASVSLHYTEPKTLGAGESCPPVKPYWVILHVPS